jgi:hypothetical protein
VGKEEKQGTCSGKKSQRIQPLYRTQLGRMFVGKVEDVLQTTKLQKIRGKVDLLFTSPPFPLVHKKRYGNETGEAYLKWLEELAPKFTELLSDSGSIVMEVGNSWLSGEPIMSTLNLESLLAFKRAAKLHLCSRFKQRICRWRLNSAVSVSVPYVEILTTILMHTIDEKCPTSSAPLDRRAGRRGLRRGLAQRVAAVGGDGDLARAILRLADVRLAGGGLLNSRQVAAFLQQLGIDQSFESYARPYAPSPPIWRPVARAGYSPGRSIRRCAPRSPCPGS